MLWLTFPVLTNFSLSRQASLEFEREDVRSDGHLTLQQPHGRRVPA